MPSHIQHGIPRHILLIRIQEHLQRTNGNGQITIIKLIPNIKAQGPKLPPLLNDSMEETQREDKFVPVSIFNLAFFEELFV